MRSDIVLEALNTKNRFALCHEAFKAVRLLHKNNNRIADTTNEALRHLAGTETEGLPEHPDRPTTTVAEPILAGLEE